MAFLRGRFCELAAEICGLNPTEQYLLGLLSLLPAMLRLPMEELAPALPLREAIRQALNDITLSEGILLEWLVNHEHGNWPTCDAIAQTHGLDQEQLQRFYGEAVAWAESALHFA
jgi:EAL and modified HD-GYP domain-containing signal transduction protein